MAIAIEVDKIKFLVPESSDPCSVWERYFNKLKEETGTDNAKMLWLLTWKHNSSTSCTMNADFNRFLKQNDIDVSNAATRAIADFSAIGNNLFGLGKNITKMATLALPIVSAILLMTFLYFIIKTAKNNDVKDLLEMSNPVGNLKKMIK